VSLRSRIGYGLRRLGGWVRFSPRAIQIALRVLEGESVRLRAMALTYISLFALVPALVVAFTVVEAFTGMQPISEALHGVLLDNLAVGARATLEPYLDRFVENAHVKSAGAVGALLLLWSAVTLFSNVERAVNDIWGIRRRRTITQQAVIYWMGLTLGPLLLAASVAVGGAARGWLAGAGVRSLGVAASALLTCAFFGTLYLIVPATKVRFRAAAAGGLAAGLAWELAKWLYTFAVARIFRYHVIYGSVAAVPIFFLWLFVSWSLLLFGARLAFLFQYPSVLRPGGRMAAPGTGREIVTGEAMLEISLAFDRGAEPPDAGDVASRCQITPDDAGEAIALLRTAGLVVAAADGGLLPSRPLEKITLLDVRHAVDGPVAEPGPDAPVFEKIVKDVEDQAAERLAGTTFRELVDRARAERADEALAADPGAPGAPPRTSSAA
jgi:membrane protein